MKLLRILAYLTYPLCALAVYVVPWIVSQDPQYDALGYGIFFTGSACIGYFLALPFLVSRLRMRGPASIAAFSGTATALAAGSLIFCGRVFVPWLWDWRPSLMEWAFWFVPALFPALATVASYLLLNSIWKRSHRHRPQATSPL